MRTLRIYFKNVSTLSKSDLNSLQKQYIKNPLSLLEMTKVDARRVVNKITKFYQKHLKSSAS